jgi:hypothetical protein
VVDRALLLHTGGVGLRLQILDQPKQAPGDRFDEIVGGLELGLREVVLVECDVKLCTDLPRRVPRARPRWSAKLLCVRLSNPSATLLMIEIEAR